MHREILSWAKDEEGAEELHDYTVDEGVWLSEEGGEVEEVEEVEEVNLGEGLSMSVLVNLEKAVESKDLEKKLEQLAAQGNNINHEVWDTTDGGAIGILKKD